MATRPLVSVIVPALDAAATIGATLEALARQDLAGPFEVIVVDDGSSDDTISVAQAASLPVRVLRQSQQGPGPARNLGAAQARAPALAFTDADCMPTPGWLREGLAELADADFVQGRVEAEPGAPGGPFSHTVWVTGSSPLYETANVLIRSELFERLGGFEDWLPVRIGKPLAEDVWLGWRARRAGARMRFAERALVHHAVLPRGPGGYVAERMRLAYFPALVAKIPELRRELLFAGLFLTSRSARFDLACAAAAASLLASSPLPLLAAVPYAGELARRSAHHRRRAPLVAAVELAADAVGLAALLFGSARWRSPVL